MRIVQKLYWSIDYRQCVLSRPLKTANSEPTCLLFSRRCSETSVFGLKTVTHILVPPAACAFANMIRNALSPSTREEKVRGIGNALARPSRGDGQGAINHSVWRAPSSCLFLTLPHKCTLYNVIFPPWCTEAKKQSPDTQEQIIFRSSFLSDLTVSITHNTCQTESPHTCTRAHAERLLKTHTNAHERKANTDTCGQKRPLSSVSWHQDFISLFIWQGVMSLSGWLTSLPGSAHGSFPLLPSHLSTSAFLLSLSSTKEGGGGVPKN